MRIVVYPHDMAIGGSQMNAIDLASAMRARGHEVLVYGGDGPLVERVRGLGLEYRLRHSAPRQPSIARARDLAEVAREWRADVLHGYEWPPILEAAAAAVGGGQVAVGTVLSMAVAEFIPQRLPLIVGTREIERSCARRRGSTWVIEPPVDTRLDRPGVGGAAFRERFPIREGEVRIVIVSRLVPELKLEGICTAVRAMPGLAHRCGRSKSVKLTIVGDGSARARVEEEVGALNLADRRMVELLGAHEDPRGAYDAADIVLGMGGSALRGLAFAKPLVVQGEGGFFEPLTQESLPLFLDQGFYGRSALGDKDATARLTEILLPLVSSAELRQERGAWGRRVVEDRFSLESAAARLERVYDAAIGSGARRSLSIVDGCLSIPRLLDYKVSRVRARRRGVIVDDDFNARSA